MAKDIADGYLMCTEKTFARLLPAEVDQLGFEIDRALREVRGNQPSLDDMPAIQQRNRRIQRLNGAFTMLRSYQARRRPTPSPAAAAAAGPGKPGAKGGPKRPPQA
jgi:hypothetical protein